MTINYDEDARPVVWLLHGDVDYKGKNYVFWYEHDGRDGECQLEFWNGEPDDNFDYEYLEEQCEARLARSWAILRYLDTEVTS